MLSLILKDLATSPLRRSAAARGLTGDESLFPGHPVTLQVFFLVLHVSANDEKIVLQVADANSFGQRSWPSTSKVNAVAIKTIPVRNWFANQSFVIIENTNGPYG